jgi:putative component of membrane protein insertase Oxa1/YidC/SpoIIIJ protein YidD
MRLISWALRLSPNGSAPAPAAPPRRGGLWFLNPLSWGVLLLILLYQRLVPAGRKPTCRFKPSCSAYMSRSIRKYGLRRGFPRGLNRLRRCAGFLPQGEDWP